MDIALIPFAETPRIIHKFSDKQDRDSVAAKIESIRPAKGQPSYAKAVKTALDYYTKNRRESARGLFVVVGNGGKTADRAEERSLASNQIRRVFISFLTYNKVQ